jgi:hypothetical protein
MARVFNAEAKGTHRIVPKDIHPSGKIHFDQDGYVELEDDQALKLSEVPGYFLEEESEPSLPPGNTDQETIPDSTKIDKKKKGKDK